MSKTIDERVVKMEFDNSKFESRAKTSLNTLDRLKKALNFDEEAKSIRELQKEANKLTLDDLGASLNAIQKRFSTFGIAGMTVVQDLTRSFENFAKKTANSLMAPFQQIKTGGWARAMKIKDAKFAIEGLGKDFEKYKEDINDAVAGTAYGYDSAARAASQFAASGIQVGKSAGQMGQALRSISGVAAQTNSSYDDIANIFTTIAANGKVMTQQLRQLSFRGMNAAAVLAKSLGKSEAEVNQMVSKGQISFAQFAEAMDNAFGEHATQANETFQGALDNMKAALSRVGANFADPLIDAERDIFNRLRDIINSTNKMNLTDAGQKLQKHWDNMFAKHPEEKTIENLNRMNRALSESTTYVTEVGQKAQKEYDELMDRTKNGKKATEEQAKRIAYLQGEIEKGTVKGSGAILRLSSVVNQSLEEARSKIVGFFEQGEMSTALNNIIDSVREIYVQIMGFVQPIKEAWRQIFPERETKILAELTDRFKKFTQQLKLSKEYGDDVRNIFAGLFEVFRILMDILSGLFNIVSKLAGPAFGVLIKVLSYLGEAAQEVGYRFDQLKAGVEFIVEYFQKAVDLSNLLTGAFSGLAKVAKVVGSVLGVIVTILGGGLFIAVTLVYAALSKLSGVVQTVYTFLEPVITAIVGFFSKVGGLIKGAFESINKPIDTFAEGTAKVNQNAKEIKKRTVPVFQTLIGVLKVAATTIRDFVANGINFLGDAISNFSLEGFITGIRDRFIAVVEAIKSGAMTIPQVLRNGVVAGFSGIVRIVKTAKDVVTGFFKTLFSGKEILKDGHNQVKAVEKTTGSFFDKIKDFIKAITESEAFKKMKEGLEGITEAIGNFTKEITPARIFALLFVVAVVLITKAIYQLMNAITGFVTAATGVPKSIAGMFDSVKGLVNQIKENITPVKKASTQFKEIAEGILIIAGAFALLAQIKPEDLAKAAIVLGGTLAAILIFYGIMGAISKMPNNVRDAAMMTKLVGSVLKLAASLVLMALAIGAISKLRIDPGQTFKNIIIALVGLAGVAAVMAVFSHHDKGIKTNALVIMGFAGALYLMAETFRKLIGIDWHEMWKTFWGIIPVIATVGALAAIMGKVKFTNALGILGVVVSLYALMPIFKKLVAMDWEPILPILKVLGTVILALIGLGSLLAIFTGGDLFSTFEAFGTGMRGVGASFILMAGAVGILGMMKPETLVKGIVSLGFLTAFVMGLEFLAGKTKENDMKTFGIGMLLVASSMTILAGIAAVLSTMDVPALVKGVGAVGVTMLLVGYLMYMSKYAKGIDGKGIALLFSLTIDILILSGALVALAQIPFDQVLPAAGALLVVMLAFGKVIEQVQKLGRNAEHTVSQIAVLLAVAGAIAGLVIALKFLSEQPWQGLIAAGAAMGMAMLAFAGAVFIVQKSLRQFKLKTLGPNLLLMLTMVGVMAALGVALGVLAHQPWEGLLAAAGAMSATLLAFALSIKMVSKVKLDPTLLIGFLGIIPPLLAIVAGLYILAQQPWDSLLAGAAAIAVSLLAMSAVITILQKIPYDAGIRAAVALIGFVGVMAAGLALIDQLCKAFGAGGIDYIVHLFEKLGEMLGGFISGIGKGLTSQLPGMGEDLAGFAEAAQPFFDQMSTINGTNVKAAVEAMCQMITSISAYNLLDSLDILGNIGEFFTGKTHMDELGENFKTLGKALKTFADSVKGIAVNEVTAAAEALSSILNSLSDLPRSGGVVGKILGDKQSMEDLSNGLKELGPALTSFTKNTKNLSVKGVEKAQIAMGMITEFAKDIPNSGGLLGDLLGNNDMDAFAKMLPTMGVKLNRFCELTKNLDTSGVKAAKTAVEMITEFAKEIPNSGGLIGMLAGNNDMDDFAKMLPSVAEELVNFNEKCKGLEDATKARNLVDLLISLANVSSSLKDSGTSTLGTFVERIKRIGPHYTAFIKGLPKDPYEDKAKVDAFCARIRQIKRLSDEIGGGTINNLAQFSKDLSNLSYTGLNLSADQAITELRNGWNSALSDMTSTYVQFKQTAQNQVGAFQEGIEGSSEAVVSSWKGIITNVITYLADVNTKDKFVSNGKILTGQFAAGIQNQGKIQEVINAATKVGKEALRALDNAIKDPAGISDEAMFYGEAFTRGFAYGIVGLKKQSDQASADLGESAVKQLDDAIQDPIGISDITLGLGKAFGNGFKTGIESFMGAVNQAAAALGFAGTDGLKFSMKGFTDFIDNFTGTDFASGLFKAVTGVKKKGKKAMEEFYDAMIPKKVKDIFEGDDGLPGGINDAAKTKGSKGSKGGSGKNSVKWTAKDLAESLLLISGIHNEILVKYDAFNSKLLKKSKITNEYLARSFKNANLRAAISWMGKDALTGLGKKKVEKEADRLIKKDRASGKLGKKEKLSDKQMQKYYNKAAKILAKESIKGYESEYARLSSMLKDSLGKDTLKKVQKSASFVGTFLKKYDSDFKGVSKNITHYQKAMGVSADAAKKAYENLGWALYKNSDDYKDNIKQLKANEKQREKLIKKAEKYEKIIANPNASAKQKQNAKKRLAEINKEVQTIEKGNKKIATSIAKGPEKAIKSFKKEVKNTVKEYLKLSEIDWSKVSTGFDKFEAGTSLVKESASSFDAFASSSSKAAATFAESFDVFSAAFDTGINLLEKFTKTGTAEVDALLERADGQLAAYEEFQNGIDTLRQKGLDSSMIDELEDQGPSALNYIRGFMNMSSEQIDAYNKKISKKRDYEGSRLKRSMDRQKRQYEQWVADIESLAAAGLSDGIINKLKESGVGQAEFVRALTHMDKGGLSNVASYYSKAVVESVEAANQIAEGFDPLASIKNYAQKFDEWNVKIAQLETKGLSKALYDAVKASGVEDQNMLNWILQATDEQLKEYSEYYAKYVESSSGGLTTMIENVQSQTKALTEWYDWMTQIRKVDPALYKELQQMGYETGYEYAKAWIEGDDESREKLRQAQAERDKIQLQEQLNQMRDRRARIDQWKKDMAALAKSGISEDMWYEIYDMGPESEAASIVLQDIDSFKEQYVSNAKIDEKTANSILDSYAYVNDNMAKNLDKSAKDNVEKPIKEASEKGAKEGVEAGTTKGYSEGVKKTKSEAKKAGKSIGKSIGSGLESDEVINAISSASTIVGETTIRILKSYLNKSKGESMGKNVGSGIVSGVESRMDNIRNVAERIVAVFKANVNSQLGLGLGASVVEGINLGISQAEPALYARAYSLAAQLRAIIAAALQVNSPSKVMIPIGSAIPEGLEVGMMQYAPKLFDSTREMADDFTDTVRGAFDKVNAFSMDIEANPIIKPTLDLSDVTTKARQLNSMLSDATEDIKVSTNNQNDTASKNGGMTFIQNNYSPKALDRLTIYRQTRNQFANAKGLVTT